MALQNTAILVKNMQPVNSNFMKTYEVIDNIGKSHYIAAKSKKAVLEFWYNPKKVILRKDILHTECIFSIN